MGKNRTETIQSVTASIYSNLVIIVLLKIRIWGKYLVFQKRIYVESYTFLLKHLTKYYVVKQLNLMKDLIPMQSLKLVDPSVNVVWFAGHFLHQNLSLTLWSVSFPDTFLKKPTEQFSQFLVELLNSIPTPQLA